MKQISLSILLTLFMSIVGINAFAYDIVVKNADGVTIYYNYYNEGKELQVTFLSSKDNYQENKNAYVGNVVIPEEVTYLNRTRKVTSIGDHAFRECKSLTSVTIPNSVTSIGSSAFEWCYMLTSVTIPNSVTSMGGHAFRACSSLTSVTISDIAAWCDISFNDRESNPLYYAHHLFLNGEELKDLTIPNSVTYIRDYTFSGCSNLTSVTIENSVISIGNFTFSGCSNLTSVTLPNSVTYIGESAFDNCSNLTSVTIPNGVTYIERRAFRGCSNLTSVTIGNSVTYIGSDAFEDCSNLTSVTISDITAWFSISFANISSNPLYYAHHLFLNGEELKDLTIPNSVTYIRDYAFSGCSNLTSVTLPNSVTSIGGYAFMDYTNLTSVTIGNSVTSIGSKAFVACSGLTSVTIPNSVRSIGNYAFAGCSSLISIISKMRNPCRISYNCFSDNVFFNSTLYVPQGTKENYKATPYWYQFFFIEESDPSGIGVANVKAIPVLKQGEDGMLRITGAPEGTAINVYEIGGQLVGSAKASSDTTVIPTTLSQGSIAIVKIGEKAVKVLMK